MYILETLMPDVTQDTNLKNLTDRTNDSTFDSLEEQVNNLENKVNKLEQENGILSLLTMAIMKKLCDNTPTTIEEIKGLLKAIDASDGKIDGKIDMSEVKRIFGIADNS